MAQHSLTDVVVNPTANDVSPSTADGYGRTMAENTFGQLLSSLTGSYVIDDFALPSSGSASAITLEGSAVIDGYLVYTTAASPSGGMAFSNDTHYVFLRLLKTTTGSYDYVTEAIFETNTTGATPADSIYLGSMVVAGGNVSSSIDGRLIKRGPFQGFYTGDGNSTQAITVPGIGSSNKPAILIVANETHTTDRWAICVRFRGDQWFHVYDSGSGVASATASNTSLPYPTNGGFTVTTTINFNVSTEIYYYIVLI